MLAAVCCRLEAVCSVRAERSWLPMAISDEASDTDSTPLRTSPTTPRRRATICPSERSMWPNSSLRVVWMSRVRSPAAMASMAATASSSGRVMERTRNRVISTPSTTTTAAATRPNRLAFWRVAWAVWTAASRRVSCNFTKSLMASTSCCADGKNCRCVKSCKAARSPAAFTSGILRKCTNAAARACATLSKACFSTSRTRSDWTCFCNSEIRAESAPVRWASTFSACGSLTLIPASVRSSTTSVNPCQRVALVMPIS